MNPATLYIGIDVAMDHLDIVRFDHKPTRIQNTAASIRALVKRLKATGKTVFLCCEATGGYEQTLLDTAADAGLTIARVNPARVRHFAKSDGHFAKTDALDAQLITRFAEQKKPRAYQKPPAWAVQLRALLDRRTQLIGFQTQDTHRLHLVADAIEKRLLKSHLAFLRRQLACVDKHLRDLLASLPEQHARYERLLRISGIGPATAAALLGYLPELGQCDDRPITSLAGLAPWADDSGLHTGKREIRGGRFAARKALYMAALVASRRNHVLAPFYERLVKRGKPPKLALTAVMRKLLCLANRLLRDDAFQLQPPVKPASATV